MIVSINPTYYCNFRCNFCYLTEEQLSNRQKINLEVLEQKIKEIQQHFKISMIDLYGGEVGLLPEDYVFSICDILEKNGIDDINIITNLSMVNNVINHPNFYVTVSYDFSCREQSDRVWKNMTLLTKPFSILILASYSLIKNDPNEMIFNLNLLSNLNSVEIKPYSTNQANQQNVTFKQYEEFVKQWITSPIQKNFTFVNELLIKDVLNGYRNSFSDDHVYITPNGNYGVLEFDLNDNEFFLEYSTFEEYLKWCKIERERVSRNKFCSNCNYFGRCLSEHLREVKNLDNSCNGFKLLIDWYKNYEVSRD